MGKALILTVGGLLTAFVNVLFADKLRGRIISLTSGLLDLAVARLPDEQRERFAEEWASHLNDLSSDVGKILFARGCITAAHEIASLLGYKQPALHRLLNRSLEFLKRIWKRVNNLPNFLGALLFGENFMLAKKRLAPTIVVSTLLTGLAGFLFSYCFTPRYTAVSEVLIEGQKVPESMVQPIVLQDLAARVWTLQNQVLAESKLRLIVEKLYPGFTPVQIGEKIDEIRLSMSVEPVPSDLLAIGASKTDTKPDTSPFPAFYVKYIASNATEAQQMCNELTDLMVREYANQINDAAAGTSEVLNRAIEVEGSRIVDLEGRLRNVDKL